MSAFRAHKLVAALPDPLEPNALYLLRTGAGFDLYASDQTGSAAHKLNAGDGGGAAPAAALRPPAKARPMRRISILIWAIGSIAGIALQKP